MPLPVERREPGRMSSWFTSFSGASGASRGTETEDCAALGLWLCAAPLSGALPLRFIKNEQRLR